jgi:hypothetical protein
LQRPYNSYFWRNFAGINGTTLVKSLSILFDHYNRETKILNDPLTMLENKIWWKDNLENFSGTVDPIGSCGYYNGPACNKSGIGCGTYKEMQLIKICEEGVGFWVTEQENCQDISKYAGINHTKNISGILYRCNSSNQWIPYYRPYIYPHPLRISPLGTKLCGEGKFTSSCWCEEIKSKGYCCQGYFQTTECSTFENIINEEVYNPADTNKNNCINNTQVILFIDQWKNNQLVTFKELINYITQWK